MKQLGNAIAQSLLNSVTEAMSPQLAGLARIPQQSLQLPNQNPIPINPLGYQNYYPGPQRGGRGRGNRGRGRGNRGNRGRGRGNRFSPYEHQNAPKRDEDIARLTSELEKERDERKKLELELDLTRLSVGNKATGKLLDSHFHWDRLNKVKRVTLEKLTSDQIMPTPKSELSIEGGIMVFCDPKDFPNNEEIGYIKRSGKFGIAMGIHPNHSKGNLDKLEPSVQLIREQMERGNLNGLGEVGLDFMKGGQIKKQEQILEWILPLAKPEIPLILHIRGIPEDSNNELAYNHALQFLLSKQLNTNQTIQLHSFTGNNGTVKKWLQKFPNCYFSFSGLIQKFNQEQLIALKEVPSNRLLLETDSPYLPIRKEIKCNFPGYLGETAQKAATIRNEPIGQLVANTWTNTNLIFFKHHV